MPTATAFGYEAGEDILPARFVKLSTTEDHIILEADAGDKPVGIMHRGTRRAPYSSLDDGLAAKDGESGFRIFVNGEVCGLELGGTVTAGERIKATTAGKGIAATAGAVYGAVALTAGVSGEIIQVIIEIGAVPA